MFGHHRTRRVGHEAHEIGVGLLDGELNGVIIDLLHARQRGGAPTLSGRLRCGAGGVRLRRPLQPEEGGLEADKRALVFRRVGRGVHHIVGRELDAVVPLDVLPQVKGVDGAVWTDRPFHGQIGHQLQEGLVREIELHQLIEQRIKEDVLVALGVVGMKERRVLGEPGNGDRVLRRRRETGSQRPVRLRAEKDNRHHHHSDT